MKFKHFLVKRAYTFDERESNDPEDCVYDEIKGLWVHNKDKKVLVKSNHPKCLNITSKKQNVEKT
jgi:hypothetical protein